MTTDGRSMRGTTVVVTGATQGIGEAAARQLAGLGAEVVVVGRNRARAEGVIARINQRVSPAVPARFLIADLSVIAEVRTLAARIRETTPRLHVLFNNAGAIFSSRQLTHDGFERTFALNHLAAFVLTTELLDLLRASGPGRVVTTSSTAHAGARLDLDDLQSERNFSTWGAYGRSKLANILFTRELARRLHEEGSPITANCFHPGVIASGFGHNNGALMTAVMTLARPFLTGPDRGADTGVYLCSEPSLRDVSGEYFVRRAPHATSRAGQDAATARRLWELSEEMTAASASSPPTPLE